jgi:hypothetical protein
VFRATEKTATKEGNIRDWLQLDEGDPVFKLMTEEQTTALIFLIYYHQHCLFY